MNLASKNKQINKVLVLKKIENKQILELKNQIHSLFNNPATFLQLPSESNLNFVVGKKIKGPRFDVHDKLVTYSVVGSPLKYLKRRNKSFSVLTDEPIVNNKMSKQEVLYKNMGIKDEPEIKIIDITDKEVRNLFKNINDNIKNKKNESNNILKNINCNKYKKDIIKMPFLNQENSLKNIQKLENVRKLFEDKKNKILFVNKHKKNSNSLLLKSELYRLKRENINYITSQQKNNIGNGLQKWAFSLREPKVLKGVRREYVNVGSDKKPVWVKLQEKYPIKIENVYNPDWKNEDKYFKTMSNFSFPKKTNKEDIFLKTAPNFGHFKEKTMNLEGLQITGINLFDIEKKNVENLRGKKKQLQKFIYNKECLEDQNYIEKWNIKEISNQNKFNN